MEGKGGRAGEGSRERAWAGWRRRRAYGRGGATTRHYLGGPPPATLELLRELLRFIALLLYVIFGYSCHTG